MPSEEWKKRIIATVISISIATLISVVVYGRSRDHDLTRVEVKVEEYGKDINEVKENVQKILDILIKRGK